MIEKQKQQFNTRICWCLLIVFPILYGFAESALMLNCISTGDKVIFGMFSLYHLFMFFLFVVFALTVDDGWMFIPALFVIEDIVFYLYRGEWAQPGDWVSDIFGGFYANNIYIPFAYIVGLILTCVFIIVDVILKFNKFGE